MIKKCKDCQLDKEFIQFYKHKTTKDGFHPCCIVCEKKKRKIKRDLNKNIANERSKQWYLKNKERALIRNNEYRKNNLEKFREYNRKYSSKNKELLRIKSRKWAEENPDRVQFLQRRARANNPKKYRDTINNWNNKNRGKVRQRDAAYKANKKAGTIGNGIYKSELEKIYTNCPSGYEVDHIIPIVHPLVCGLHVPWNLQYLNKIENRRKGNRL